MKRLAFTIIGLPFAAAALAAGSSGVVTSRGLVRYVVTEFGVAYLHGKSIRERAKALIDISHPDFRDELYTYCEQTKWLQRPQSMSATR